MSNFAFLEGEFPVLANFGDLAEKYLYSDPNSSLMKQGMIGETIVNLMFTYDRIPQPYEDTAVLKIDTLYREGLLTKDLTDILHALRKVRNKAVHQNYSSTEDAKIFLQMAYSLCEWFMQTYGDYSYQNRPFVMPLPEEEKIEHTDAQKAAEEKKEQELTEKAENTAQDSEKVDPEARKKQAKKAASKLIKSEAETRYLIDAGKRT